MSDNQRLALAFALSLLIVLAWQYFFTPIPAPHTDQPTSSLSTSTLDVPKQVLLNRDELILDDFSKNHRIKITTPTLKGSINLVGARIDDLSFEQYSTSIDPHGSKVVLFSPSQTKNVYFTEIGWISNDKNITLPDKDTIWHANKDELKANDTVILYWINPQNIEFNIRIHLDEDYMFDITKTIKNLSQKPLTIQSYYLISRTGSKDKENLISHEGAIGVVRGTLQETSFEDLEDKKEILYEDQSGGWIGFSDKYWLSALIASQNTPSKGEFLNFKDHEVSKFQANLLEQKVQVEPNSKDSSQVKLFAGVKKLELLHRYQDQYGIVLFDRAVDFGMLYFITKPIFLLLSYFYKLIGNFGLAILLLTVVIKAVLFPLAYKGFKGMNRLKDLQPQMASLKEKYKDEPALFQKAIVDLYKREKVNPVSGCLPLILQMPVFFALYKVLYVTLEMRHAPFFWWIQDLSAPDPTSIFNLFGLIPWNLPALLQIGVFPIIMSLTMYFQQRLSPEPTDPVQAKMMKMLPLIFLFIFSSFPSGLIVYWAWSNVLSIIQQILIKRLSADK